MPGFGAYLGPRIVKPVMDRRLLAAGLLSCLLAACGGGGASQSSAQPYAPITVSGLQLEKGNFDPAPTRDENGDLWMSYSHVSVQSSGLDLVETRLATSNDEGLTWADSGVQVNSPETLSLPPPSDVNAVTHEVSRLVYDPFAVAAGADPWILLWHRYLSVLINGQKQRLFQHGWIGLKTGPTPMALAGERKLFAGAIYDPVNNGDSLGPPEYQLNLLDPALSGCVSFSEPGVLAKQAGVYIALLCAKATRPNKIVLLRCDHRLTNCVYIGDLLNGSEASTVKSGYDDFSAPELVSTAGQDYLIASPVIAAGGIYRGCVVYRIPDIQTATVEHQSGKPVAYRVIPERGDFNGACAFVDGMTGSGIMMGEAFFSQVPVFRLFATAELL